MRSRPPAKWRFGIAARSTTITVGVILLSALLISLTSIEVMTRNMRTTIDSEQVARLTSIGQGIDGKFSSRKILLRTLAESVPKSLLPRPALLQAYLVELPSLKLAFDNVSILDLSGLLVANLNRPDPIGKLQVSDRDYFRNTIDTGKGVISKPIRNRYSGLPQITMTEPLRDADGKILYVISASINLQEDNFLGEFATVQFGRTGYLFIINSDGIVIDHPEKKRILTLVNGPGHESAPVKQALAGFEGSMQATNSYGVEGLFTYKRIASTDWILGAIYPNAEAFAPIVALEQRLMTSAFLLALCAGAISAWALRRQLRPLLRLQQAMQVDAAAPVECVGELPMSDDEVGDIAIAYAELQKATISFSAQLARSEQQLRDILTHAGDAFISLDPAGAIAEWNRQAEETFGWTRNEVLGKPLADILIPPRWRDAHAEGMKTFAVSGTGPVINKRIELMALHRDGHEIAVELSIAASFDGTTHIANAFVRDISARKEAERKITEGAHFLRTITDNLPALIGYVGIDERYRFANKGFQRFLNVDPNEILGKSMREVLGELAYAQVKPSIEKVKRGKAAHFERDSTVAGQSIHFMGDYIPDVKDGEVVGFFLLVLDISARKNAEIGQALSEQRLKSITDNLPSMIAQIDRDERYVFVNEFIARTFGVSPADMIGKSIREIRGEAIYAQIGPFVQRALQGEIGTFEGHAHGIDRGDFFYQAEYRPSFDHAGNNNGFYVMAFDITERKRAEQRQADNEQRMRLITDNLPVLIAYMDKDHRFQFGNATFKEWLDVDPIALRGQPLPDVIGRQHYQNRLPYLERALAGETVRFFITSEAKGIVRHLHTVYIPHKDSEGSVLGVYTLTSDVTAQKNTEEQLAALALVDSLTGLPNRRQFDKQLDEVLGRVARSGDLLALLFLDIDHFKTINDTLGHGAGDEVLRTFAHALRQAVRRVDVVARLAGDEFVVVMEGLRDHEEAILVADKVLLAVARTIGLDTHTLSVTTSIGIAFSDDTSQPAKLMAYADQALYQAKRNGRNQSILWSSMSSSPSALSKKA